MQRPIISLVVAMSVQTRAIGKGGALLWRIPEDMQHFKAVTTGHPIIMGRKTFDSIGRILPERPHVVVTRNPALAIEGVIVCTSFSEALQRASAIDSEEVCVIGGGDIFTLALPLAHRIYLTLVDDPVEGDAYFPEYDASLFEETSRKDGVHDGISYSIRTLDRKRDSATGERAVA